MASTTARPLIGFQSLRGPLPGTSRKERAPRAWLTQTADATTYDQGDT